MYGNCSTPSVEPAEIVLACADYGALLEGLRWTSWTAASAMAVGTLVYNDCTPNCAEGHHHRVPGTRVTLTVPVHGVGGQVVWSQIQEHPSPGIQDRPVSWRPAAPTCTADLTALLRDFGTADPASAIIQP